MTDREFDILDELYFVQSFEQLKDATGLEEAVLIDNLKNLYSKDWIKVFIENGEKEVEKSKIDLPINYNKYLYLASKKGLMAHNSIE